MTLLHLIEGPVGAGKSTFAADLARRIEGVHIPLDEWFTRLFSPDRPATDVMAWYVQRKQRLLDLIWIHALAVRASGTSPILELGLIQRRVRTEFYERARSAGVEIAVDVLDAPRDVRRERVRRRNGERGPTFSMVVPDDIFEMASDLWEPPDAEEISTQNIRLIRTTT